VSDISIHIPGWLVLLVAVCGLTPGAILLLLPVRIMAGPGPARVAAGVAMALSALAYLLLFVGPVPALWAGGAAVFLWLGSAWLARTRPRWLDPAVLGLTVLAGSVALLWFGT
jgi:hypothetical protein